MCETYVCDIVHFLETYVAYWRDASDSYDKGDEGQELERAESPMIAPEGSWEQRFRK